MPLPQMLQTMMMAMASRAIHQLELQLEMAEPERQRPMAMMIGPVTTGGKKRMTFFGPKAAKRPARMKYIKPAQTTPMQAYGSDSANESPCSVPICVTAA